MLVLVLVACVNYFVFVFCAVLLSCRCTGSDCQDFSHDDAQLITAIDRSGGTTGLAWVGTICKDSNKVGPP